MRDFRKLDLWHRARELVRRVYKETLVFPAHEMYGLTSQIRRSAGSIPANVAEGCGRTGQGDSLRFLEYAMGSACELDTWLCLAADLGYLPTQGAADLQGEVIQLRSMLAAYMRKVGWDG